MHLPRILEHGKVFPDRVVEAEVDHVEGAVPAHGGGDALAQETVSTVTLQGQVRAITFSMSIMSFVGAFPCNPSVRLQHCTVE